jgi:hypothetical protein
MVKSLTTSNLDRKKVHTDRAIAKTFVCTIDDRSTFLASFLNLQKFNFVTRAKKLIFLSLDLPSRSRDKKLIFCSRDKNRTPSGTKSRQKGGPYRPQVQKRLICNTLFIRLLIS